MDRRRRELERGVIASGDDYAMARVLAERMRSGEISKERVVLSAKLGDRVADKVEPQKFIANYREHLLNLFEHGENTTMRIAISSLRSLEQNLGEAFSEIQRYGIRQMIEAFEDWYVNRFHDKDDSDYIQYVNRIVDETNSISQYPPDGAEENWHRDHDALQDGGEFSSPQAELAHKLADYLPRIMEDLDAKPIIERMINFLVFEKYLNEDQLDEGFRRDLLPWVREERDDLLEKVQKRTAPETDENLGGEDLEIH